MIQVILAGAADLAAPAQYGLRRLARALEGRGCGVWRVEGPASSGVEAGLVFVAAVDATAAGGPESFSVRPDAEADGGAATVWLTGGDARGLMYVLLEASRRVELAGDDVLAQVETALTLFPSERAAPERRLRSLTVFPHHAELEAEWYRSLEFWDWYFDLLALHRFNRFTLTYGHQTAYLAPPYPHFVEVPEHPEVTVPGLTPEARDANLALLRGIAQRATERGIDFALGVWSQHAYTFGKSMVDGLEKENLASFCGHGMRRILEAVPEITAVQLRVNSESGIHLDEGTEFWRTILEGVAAASTAGRRITLDLRAKAITDETIQAGLATGLPVVVDTKFWTEHHGPPYHATLLQEGDRYVKRHSYGDQLRYPRGKQRPFDYMFQLWNLGTNRLLLWADPDWVRRFAAATELGGSIGFEVCAPLSHKGFGQRGGAWRIFKDRGYDWYRWEQERYWYWYALFGRLGYAGDADPDAWRREWAARLRPETAPSVERALGTAARVLPLLTASHSPSASVFGYWPEKDMGGLLDLYMQVPGSDVAMFASAEEAVRDALGGGTARETPSRLAEVLESIASEAEHALESALRTACPTDESAASELRGLSLDVRIQSQLARYHAAKGRAAESLAWFYETGDLDSVLAAKPHTARALEQWERLVALTDGVYQDDLIFGRPDDQDGHWKHNLVYAHHDVARLDEVETIAHRYGLFDVAFDYGAQLPNRTGTPPLPYLHDYSVERRFTAVGPQTLYSPQRGYGWGGTYGLLAAEAPKIDGKTLRASGPRPSQLPREPLYCDHIGRHPAAPYDNATFLVDLPNGDYEVTVILADRSAEPRAHGPMTVRLQGRHELGPVCVPAGEILDLRQQVTVTNGRLDVELSASAQADFLLAGLVLTRVAPHWGHRPPRAARPGIPLDARATLTSPAPLTRATVHYRFTPQAPFATAPLCPADDASQTSRALRFAAQISIPETVATLEYYLEAVDAHATSTYWPAAGPDAPHRLYVGASSWPPEIEHTPVLRAAPNQPLEIRARVTAGAPLARVTLYYRNLNQMQSHDRLEMTPVSADGLFTATIPADHVSIEWDLMYHLEAVDVLGNATFHLGLTAATPYVIVPVDR